MNKIQLLDTLRLLAETDDEEVAHVRADQALLGFIDDPEVTAAFDAIPKWYA